ncbi:hypothetical protein OCU04_000190 [Sclerotinia nivalis]|uniref:Cytochrome P450 n=1 Tax=Sclerotinia nivalis TaxID=352851 RepID=A0A9X0AW82_9HELO|nr:hypothetical protein OCU04_000190 [Sclerotinia nivalis]
MHFYEAKEQILQTLDEILFANLDVTMGGISWVLMFLGAHPDFQKELRTEIMSHTSSKSSKDSEQHYLLSGSTLLAASIMKSSRLKPLAAFTIPQQTQKQQILKNKISSKYDPLYPLLYKEIPFESILIIFK